MFEYTRAFKHWLDGAGTDLKNFTRFDVQRYIDYMVSHKKSTSTINKGFNTLKKYCKWANKTETIEDVRIVKQQARLCYCTASIYTWITR
ncbi:site-specific integrase [Bacillus cereus]|uniref:site-specific integrase n=1 Tax=Bacillus cereus TaxID=1396 RepID=UPI001E5A0294|nr:site-specific integrase [Bacillus cereus]